MWCNQIFAILSYHEIKEIYVVKNTIVCDNYEFANQLARQDYGFDALAIETTNIPVSIGDHYDHRTGTFYRKDTENVIEPNKTPEEEIKELKKTVNALLDYEADLLYEVSLLRAKLNS